MAVRMMATVRRGGGGNGISGREALFIFYGSGRALVSVCLPSCLMVKSLGRPASLTVIIP